MEENQYSQIPVKFNENYINSVVAALCDAVHRREIGEAQKYLETYFYIKPACKLYLLNNSTQEPNKKILDQQILDYLSSSSTLDSTTSLQINFGNQSSSNLTYSPGMQSTIGNQTIQAVIQNTCASLDQVNKEIYDKLIKAGNNRNDATYAATGVSTMAQAIERLKNKKK
jgi:hypothetical protein